MKKLAPLILLMICQLYVNAQIKREGTYVYVKNDQHQPINGFLWTNSGAFYKGQISFQTKMTETQPKDPKGNPTTGKPIKNYYIKGYSVQGQTFKPEEVFMYGSTEPRYVKDFMRKDRNGALVPSKQDHENFHPGHIIGSDGSKSEGFLAVRTGSSINDHVLFAETMDGPVSVFYQQPEEFHRPFNLKHVIQTINGNQVEHYPTIKGFSKADGMRKAESTTIKMSDGTELTGIAEFASKSWNYGMSVNQLLVFFDGSGLTQTFSPAFGSEIDLVIFGGEEFLAFDDGFYPKNKIMKKLTKSKKNDEQNFQPGYVMFSDGTREDYQIARARKANRGFYTLDQSGVFKAYYGTNKVKYFSQFIDGKEVRYRRIRDRYETWHQPEEDFSYCVNPYPTHVRKGLTKFVQGVTAATVEVVTDELIEASAKQAIKQGGNVRDVMNQAVEMDEGISVNYSDTEGGIYFDEYIIFKKGAPASIVYTKNMDTYISNVVTNCNNFTSLDKKDIKRLGNIDKLDETISFLNANGCAN